VTPIPIPFGAWKPDQATFQSDALVDALNVVPVPGGYGPAYDFNLIDGVSLTPPITWTDIAYAPPFTYSNTSTNIFFRLIER